MCNFFATLFTETIVSLLESLDSFPRNVYLFVYFEVKNLSTWNEQYWILAKFAFNLQKISNRTKAQVKHPFKLLCSRINFGSLSLWISNLLKYWRKNTIEGAPPWLKNFNFGVLMIDPIF